MVIGGFLRAAVNIFLATFVESEHDAHGGMLLDTREQGRCEVMVGGV